MLNKSLAFGIVAAAMLIAPTAALANDQAQYNEQITKQNGEAIGRHNSNNQNSENRNHQQQFQENRYYRKGDRYYDNDRYNDHYRDHDRYNDHYRDRDDNDYYHH